MSFTTSKHQKRKRLFSLSSSPASCSLQNQNNAYPRRYSLVKKRKMFKMIVVKVVWTEYENRFELMNGKVSGNGNANWLMELRAESQPHARAHNVWMRPCVWYACILCPAPLPFIFHFFKSTFISCSLLRTYTLRTNCEITVPNTLSFSSTFEHSIWFLIFIFSSLFRFQNLYLYSVPARQHLVFFFSFFFHFVAFHWLLLFEFLRAF